MEGDVDMASAFGLGVIDLQRLAKALALLLHAEGENRAVAADRRRPGARVEVVCHDDAVAGRLVEMDMAVDTTRQNEQSCRVDHLIGFGKLCRKGSDAAVLDAHIAHERVARCDHRAVSDDRIEAHDPFLLKRRRPRDRRRLRGSDRVLR